MPNNLHKTYTQLLATLAFVVSAHWLCLTGYIDSSVYGLVVSLAAGLFGGRKLLEHSKWSVNGKGGNNAVDSK